MTISLRLLVIEHNPADVELSVAELERAGFEVSVDVVDTRQALLARLPGRSYDIALADYRLPTWTGMDALATLREQGSEVPLILVTGTLGDERAVECVRQGAADYILKENLARLPLAVRRVLNDRRLLEERTQAAATLHATEERYRLLFESMPLPVWVFDVETHRVLAVNAAAVLHYGYSREEFLALRIEDLRPPEDVARLLDHMRTSPQDGGLQSSGRWRHRKKDGSLILVEVTWHSVTWGRRQAEIVAATDITERTRAEEARRDSEEQFRLLLDSTAEGIYGLDDTGRCTFCNPAAVRLLGYQQPEDLVGKQMHHLTHHTRPDGSPYPIGECLVYQAFRQGQGTHSDDELFWRRDGSSFPVEYWAHPIRQRSEVVGAVVTFLDISERKQNEQALRESEERFRQLADNSKEMFFISDASSGYTIYLSPAYEEIWGRSRESAYAAPGAWLDGLHPEDRARLAAVEQQGSGEASWDVFRVVRPDGSIRWVRSHASPVLDAEGRLYRIVGVAEDFTERRRAEEALAESEELYRKVTETSFDGIGVTEGGIMRQANRGFAEMLGYSVEDVIGRPILDFVAEESIELVRQHVAEGTEGTYELVGKRKDGSKIRLEATARMHLIEGRQGRITALRDVTEKRVLEEQFRQAQKMEAVGRLAGGVAHDFNNLLTVISSCTELVLMDTDEADPRRENLDEIRKAAQGAAGLTRQLLAFSRQQVIEVKLVTIEEVVTSTEKILRRVIGEDVELVTVLSHNPATIKIDPGQLEQVIMNLAVNARDAMPEGGNLTLETSSVELDETYARAHWPAIAGRFALLAVSDTGMGMTEETRARIFEPFFTTKEIGKGTGLGLATVYGIVKQSGGFIWVYSEPGKGATFKIYLPQVMETPEEKKPAVSTASLSGTETVLLIEDAPALRATARQILQRYGYSVLEAAGGKAALALAEKRSGPIHLLLTDVVMPQMSGRELAERLAVKLPGLKVLYMSGYTDDAVVRHGVLEPGIAYLQKPFTPFSLARKVREVLDGETDDQPRSPRG